MILPLGRPQLLIIAGPNGSGKSTLTRPEVLATAGLALPNDRYINADLIARALHAEAGAGSPAPAAKEKREREAFLRARALRAEYRKQGANFAFETVFSHPSTLLDMRGCSQAGYEVVLLYVVTDNPEINVARVAGRVREGGHDVPADRVRSRYERSLRYLPRAFEEADRAYVFDSTDATRLVLVKGGGGIHAVAGDAAVPVYLREQLLRPLDERERMRRLIEGKHGPIPAPDEATGAYTGHIVTCTKYYAVQALDPDETALVRHDRLLLGGETSLLHPGVRATVTYKDAAGNVGQS